MECNSADTYLGTFGTIAECAAACTSTTSCKFFIFGNAQGPQGNKAGQCYYEKTSSSTCSEGWETDSYTFYELTSGVLYPRFNCVSSITLANVDANDTLCMACDASHGATIMTAQVPRKRRPPRIISATIPDCTKWISKIRTTT